MNVPVGRYVDARRAGGLSVRRDNPAASYSASDYATCRLYRYDSGRWLTPDPDNAGADPSNPQPWNAYSYALNNPATNSEPSGLMPTVQGPLNECQITGGGLCDQPSPGLVCRLNGVSVPCGMAEGEVESGFAAECRGGACSGFRTDAQGDSTFVNFYAFGGGASGYFSASDIASGINVVDGVVLSDAGYQVYLRANFPDETNAQLGATVDALEAEGATAGEIQAFEDYENKHFSDVVVNGGNADFAVSGTGFNFLREVGSGCARERCNRGTLGTLDFSHNNGLFHLDTADPWNSPWSALVHLGVDVIGGNLWYTVIPRVP